MFNCNFASKFNPSVFSFTLGQNRGKLFSFSLKNYYVFFNYYFDKKMYYVCFVHITQVSFITRL